MLRRLISIKSYDVVTRKGGHLDNEIAKCRLNCSIETSISVIEMKQYCYFAISYEIYQSCTLLIIGRFLGKWYFKKHLILIPSGKKRPVITACRC